MAGSEVVIPAMTKTLSGKAHTFSSVGLEVDPTVTFEEWKKLGRTLRDAHRSTQWWIASWLLFGDKKFGEVASQVISDLGYDYQTLANMKWVAGRVDFSRRRENLSFSHHQEVARLEPEKQTYWLDQAEKQNWTRDELRNEMTEKGLVKDIRTFGIGALQIKVEDGTVIIALEHLGIWRDVFAGRIDDLEGMRGKIVSAKTISHAFDT